MQRFTLPRDIYHGYGSMEILKNLTGKRAIICTGGGSSRRNGSLGKAEAYLKEAGMEVKIYEGIESDPSVETVLKGAKVMQEFGPDWIIAIGGGSPIDAAKAMWIKYEYPSITFDEMRKVFGLPKLRRKAHFIAISSTSGTATEVTSFSIITDYKSGIKYPIADFEIISSTSGTATEVTSFSIITDYKSGIKYPIADFEITPDMAIIDPELTHGMPPKLVAHTGMDAFTHAVEAYVSTAHCEFTDALAIHAIEMIQKYLIPSYQGNMEARDKMHDAQCLAGMAFSNALLGIVHSMAHKTGAAFADYGAHLIHGAANAMYLPKVIQFNAKEEATKKRYAIICDYMKLGGTTDEEKVHLLIDWIRNTQKELRIPRAIRFYGKDALPTEQGFIPEAVFEERLPQIAKDALLDACTSSNPRKPTESEMKKLLQACYYDRDIDF